MKHAQGRRIAAFALAASALVGCRTRDRQASIDTVILRVDSAAGQLGANQPAPPPIKVRDASAWASGAVLGYMLATSASEIELGRLAQTKATSPVVRAFAQRMVKDHQAMMAEMNRVASSIGAVPDTAAFDARDALADARDDAKDLMAEKAGADWDREYIDDTIDSHEDMLGKLRQASQFTTDPRLRSALEQAAATINAHLNAARAIEAHQPRT